METAASLILFTYGLFGLAILITLVVLIFRRIKKKDEETFEKRDN